MIFARARQAAVALGLAAGFAFSLRAQVRAFDTAYWRFDPAPLFYLAGALGIAFSQFWARYLAICFVAALTTVNVFWGYHPAASLASGLFAIGLLSGSTMHRLFEGSAARWNRWAADLDGRIQRLRVLFVAQSVAIALVWAPADHLTSLYSPIAVVAGLALTGLVFHRTWALLLMVPVIGAEALLATYTLGVDLSASGVPAWTLPATFFAACAISAAMLAPLLRAFGARALKST